jgi:hypothetical protein
MGTWNLRTLFCLTKRWQIQIIYWFTWKYIICLHCICLKLADCFLSLPSLNMFVFVIKLSKEKTYFMYGGTWEIEHNMYCLLLTWVPVWDSAPYFHSSVSIINFVLWRGVQKYILYSIVLNVQEIFKSTFCSYFFFWFWDITPYWSLAWAW